MNKAYLLELLKGVQFYVEEEGSNMGNVPVGMLKEAISIVTDWEESKCDIPMGDTSTITVHK